MNANALASGYIKTFNSEIVLFFHCVSSICLVIWKHTVTPAFIEVAFFSPLVDGAD